MCLTYWAIANAATTQRISYSARFKLKVVYKDEKTGNRQTGREYGVSEMLVHNWREKKELVKMPGDAVAATRTQTWSKLESKAAFTRAHVDLPRLNP